MNAFEGVKILGYEVLNPRQVILTIDLNQYPSLRNPGIIKAGMKQFTEKYPAINTWKAALDGDLLYMVVNGTVNTDYTVVTAEQVDDDTEKE